MSTSSRSRRRRDDGIVVIVFALVISALLVFSALTLGGSLGYSAERNAQTSVDAAALAATNVLRDVWTGDAAAGDVATIAASVAADNGADTVTCDIVAAAYSLDPVEANVIGPCNGSNENSIYAAGVRVTATDTRDVPFGEVAGQETITAAARATATAQSVRSGGRSPFMVCTTAAGHPAPILLANALLEIPWEVNPAAIGEEFVLHGNPMKDDGRQCGGTSDSWRGLIEFEALFDTPGWWRIKTGNSTGHLPRVLSGEDACALDETGNQDVLDLTIGCKIAVPMCVTSNFDGGTNLELYCVRMGQFELTWIAGTSSGTAPCLPSDPSPPNNLICGKFIGGGTLRFAEGGSGTPQKDEVLVIKLVE